MHRFDIGSLGLSFASQTFAGWFPGWENFHRRFDLSEEEEEVWIQLISASEIGSLVFWGKRNVDSFAPG